MLVRHAGGPAVGPTKPQLLFSEIMRNQILRKPVLVTLSGAMTIIAILLADCIPWSHLNSLLQTGTDFTIADPKNGVIMPDGMWFWPAKGVGRECDNCLASILKSNDPWDPKHHPKAYMLHCVYQSECKKAWAPQKLKHVQRDPHQSTALRSNEISDESEKKIDLMQFELNWKKAQLFASFFGPPDSKLPKVTVLTDWVPPVDPTGPSATSFPASSSVSAFFSVSRSRIFHCARYFVFVTHKVKQERVQRCEM